MSEPVNCKKYIRFEFVTAIFNIDVVRFKDLLNNSEFDITLLKSICTEEGEHFPIQWVIQCWEIILDKPDTWREDLRETVRQKKMDNQEIKSILCERFDVVFTPIDIRNNEMWIYRYDAENSFEDCYDYTKEEMLSHGHEELELDLYYTVSRYDFDEVERLLKLGGNPNYIIEEEGESCLERIVARCADYCMELSDILFDGTIINPFDDNCSGLRYLLAWAINDKMFNLLSEYSDVQKYSWNSTENDTDRN